MKHVSVFRVKIAVFFKWTGLQFFHLAQMVCQSCALFCHSICKSFLSLNYFAGITACIQTKRLVPEVISSVFFTSIINIEIH